MIREVRGERVRVEVEKHARWLVDKGLRCS